MMVIVGTGHMRKGTNLFVVLFFAISLIANVSAFAHPQTCAGDAVPAPLTTNKAGAPSVMIDGHIVPAHAHAPSHIAVSLSHCSSVVAGILAQAPVPDMRPAKGTRLSRPAAPIFKGQYTCPPLGPPKTIFS
jgi:hypothetical protein